MIFTKKTKSNLLLLLTAFIWGLAFVAQSVAGEYLGPFGFNAARGLLATVVLFLFAKLRPKTERKPNEGQVADSKKQRVLLWRGGIFCGFVMFVANVLQQAGLQYTTVGKSGFITSLYVVLVPVIGFLFHRKTPLKTWIGVMLAAGALYLLCVDESLRINYGDGLTLFCAAAFSAHILIVDKYAPVVDCVWLSCVQFFVLFLCSFAGALLFETFSIAALKNAVWVLLYSGLLSSGVAYTLQLVAQKHADPTAASLIMSLESVFALLAGAVILHQFLTLREMIGCVVMLAAILLSQLPGKSDRAHKKMTAAGQK